MYRNIICISIIMQSIIMLVVPTISSAHLSSRSAYTNIPSSYLALGDSLTYGYQPKILSGNKGFANQLLDKVSGHGTSARTMRLENMGCVGETSETFIDGGCPHKEGIIPLPSKSTLRGYSSQLEAAKAWLGMHQGLVPYITLSIGMKDFWPYIKGAIEGTGSGCEIDHSEFTTSLHNLQTNLQNVILYNLSESLRDTSNGKITPAQKNTEIMMMNLYNPLEQICPNSTTIFQQINATLDNTVMQFNNDPRNIGSHVTLVDIFDLFHPHIKMECGPAQNKQDSPLCKWTWMCKLNSVYPNDLGYSLIATAFLNTQVSLAGINLVN